MSENWSLQLSIKVEGQHLLNLRADTPAMLSELIAWAEEHKEPILLACAALEGARRPEQAQPAPTPARAPIVSQGGPAREIGPIQIENVEVKKGPRDGAPWKSPMYVVKWEGQSASTFDSLHGKAAMGFWTNGNPCYLTIEPAKNPKYLNLISIRMAA